MTASVFHCVFIVELISTTPAVDEKPLTLGEPINSGTRREKQLLIFSHESGVRFPAIFQLVDEFQSRLTSQII